MTNLSAFEELEAHVKAIRGWIEHAKSAQGIPDRYAASARKITVNGNTHYDDDKLALAKAKEIAGRVEEEMRSDGERRRDQEIATARAKVEAYRVRLPDLAANACIELGVIARGMSNGC